MIEHTAECIASFNDAQKRRDEWVEKWPNYCRRCEGEGGKHYPGSRWEPPDFSVCGCWENGKCPRCGYQHSDTSRFTEMGEGPCENCGWDHDNYTPDSVPGMPECYCWEQLSALEV